MSKKYIKFLTINNIIMIFKELFNYCNYDNYIYDSLNK